MSTSKRKAVSPAEPYIVFGPTLAVQLAIAASVGAFSAASCVSSLGWFAAGLGAWTLIEYILHRFGFHSTSQSKMMKRYNSTLHLMHHETPSSRNLVAAPASFAAPIYIGVVLVTLAVSRAVSASLMLGSGVIIGYLLYEWVHYVTHQRHVKNPLLKYLKKYHLQHHFADDRSYFGVTSPIWDFVFGTKPPFRSKATLSKSRGV